MNSSAPSLVSPLPERWEVPYYIKGLALGIPVYFLAIHMWTWIFNAHVFLAGGADFRQLYVAGYMVRTGHAHELYSYSAQKQFQDAIVSPRPMALPFVRPAYEALLFVPFSFFSYQTSYLLFLAGNILVLGMCFRLLQPWTGNLKVVYPWLPYALFLGFLPIAAALIQGQDSIWLLALFTVAFVLLHEKREFLAGTMTGIGLFKFPIAIPVALLFLVWRRYRFVIGFGLSAAFLGLLSLWIVGEEQVKEYVSSLFFLAMGGIHPGSNLLAHYPVMWQTMANVHGFAFGVTGAKTSPAIQVVVIAISIVVFLWTAVRGASIRGPSIPLLLALPCGVLIGHYGFIHDLSILILPILVLLDFYLPREFRGGKDRVMFCAAALMFVAPVLESFAPNHFYLVAIPMALFLVSIGNATAALEYMSESGS